MPAPRYMTGPGTLANILANQPAASTLPPPAGGFDVTDFLDTEANGHHYADYVAQHPDLFVAASDGRTYAKPGVYGQMAKTLDAANNGNLKNFQHFLMSAAAATGATLALNPAALGTAVGSGATGAAAGDVAWGVNPITAGSGDAIALGEGSSLVGSSPNLTGFLTPSELAAVNSTFPLTSGLGADGLSLTTGLTGSAGVGSGLTLSDLLKVPTGPLTNLGGGGASQVVDLANSGGPTVPGTPSTGAASGTSAATSALAKLLGIDDATAKALSGLLGAGVGALGANAQTGALTDIYNKEAALRAPSAARFEASFAPGYDMAATDPGFKQALATSGDVATRAAGAKYGNPAESPGAMAEIQKYILGSTYLPQLNTSRAQNAQVGFNTNAQVTAGTNAANAGGGIYNAIGSGIASLSQPDNSLTSLLKQINDLKLNLGTVPV